MDYEKKKTEALEELKQCARFDIEPAKTILKLFPELEESDYVIKTKLIHLLGYFRSRGIDYNLCDRIQKWLEKQGEKSDYNPYKATIESIAAMVEKYANGDLKDFYDNIKVKCKDAMEYDNTWLEKQSEQKETHKIEPFEVEHGKYYYCIKDYFCGGRKQASKGDVVQALRGLPIMSLKDASEYFLPVNNVQKPAWSEEDEQMLQKALSTIRYALLIPIDKDDDPCFVGSSTISWLKSLKDRVQSHWKPTDEQMHCFKCVIDFYKTKVNDTIVLNLLNSLYEQLVKL